jgi:hypothetical protein
MCCVQNAQVALSEPDQIDVLRRYAENLRQNRQPVRVPLLYIRMSTVAPAWMLSRCSL